MERRFGLEGWRMGMDEGRDATLGLMKCDTWREDVEEREEGWGWMREGYSTEMDEG